MVYVHQSGYSQAKFTYSRKHSPRIYYVETCFPEPVIHEGHATFHVNLRFPHTSSTFIISEKRLLGPDSHFSIIFGPASCLNLESFEALFPLAYKVAFLKYFASYRGFLFRATVRLGFWSGLRTVYLQVLCPNSSLYRNIARIFEPQCTSISGSWTSSTRETSNLHLCGGPAESWAGLTSGRTKST